MEDLLPDSSSCGLAVIEEDDEFYEAIEAPKFVDFSLPDRSQHDDKTWFCVRIGCDLNHEEVDPDELYRSFKLRVMAARSPNVRFQRALKKQGRSARAKCPKSAPAKTTKNWVSSMSTVASISDKMAMAKLKHHPISRLRETPSQGIAEVEKLVSKKAWTSPRRKKSQTKFELFRSSKNQKASATMAESDNRIVAKALFLHTPKRSSGSSKTPVSHICSQIKKLNIHCERTRTLEGSSTISSNKCRRPSIKSKKASCLKNSIRSNLNEVLQNQVRVIEIDVEETHSNLMKPINEQSEKTSKSAKQNPDLHRAYNEARNEIRTARHVTNDDNKENSLLTYDNRNGSSTAVTSESKSLQFDACENQPLEEAKYQNTTVFKENNLHCRKIKRTTNPKPFRLRTDERGILREANLERRVQAEIKKEPSSLLKCVDGFRVESKKVKATRRSPNRSSKIELAKRMLQISSPAKEWKGPLKSQVYKGKGVHAEGNDGHKQERKSTTIPREPRFHRIHIPKSCSKRNAVSELLM